MFDLVLFTSTMGISQTVIYQSKFIKVNKKWKMYTFVTGILFHSSGADAHVVKVVISQGQKSEIIFILSESIAKQLVL